VQLHLSIGAAFFITRKGKRELKMETRVAIIGIIVEKNEAAEPLNAILHEYGSYIVGRMGIPYRRREISILSVAVDAPQDIISTLSGRIGQLDGVSAKTAYSNVISKE
jgi:putative iron-only hydrogenase system regulator